MPYHKWKTEQRNVKIGDLVLVKYASKVTKGDFRLARVEEVFPDPEGIVRTVTVIMRPRDSREKVTKEPPYLLPKPPVELKLGVQRLVVLFPVEEQTRTMPASSNLNPEAEEFVPEEDS